MMIIVSLVLQCFQPFILYWGINAFSRQHSRLRRHLYLRISHVQNTDEFLCLPEEGKIQL